ncbi:MAG: putative sulfate/molybdate transporter [Methanospirillaceae archaeon]|nr:putative sulfate/molybdate transporter [Methanospirillaceae archaeon]
MNVPMLPDTLTSRFPYIIRELAGSGGNFGTVLPLLFAVSIACGMSISLMLVWAAVFYGISGFWYRIPVPVEPLKAVGALAIAGHLSANLVAASGILVGIICLAIGMLGCMEKIEKIIPQPVIRGVQLGLAFVFVKSAFFDFILQDLWFTIISVGIISVIFLIRQYHAIPDLSAICIISAGFLAAGIQAGFPSLSVISLLPLPVLVIPSVEDFLKALVILVPSQIPLTLTNAVLATSLLVTDLYKKTISPDRLCRTVGVMSITSSLFGGFPLCHGAGGLAAHYRFGARGGLSLVFGGILLFVLAIICADPEIISSLPQGMFGVLLLVVAYQLAVYGVRTTDRLTTGMMAVLAIPLGLTVAFCSGLILSALMQYRLRKR